MPLSRKLATCWLPFIVALSACGSDGPTAVEPLPGATAVSVTLSETIPISTEGLPRLQFTGLAGAAELMWEVESPPCLLAEASAERAGSIVAIHISRSGNPLANCSPDPEGYRYVARVAGLAPGRYEVRLIDNLLGQPPREVGRGSVMVLQGF